MRLKCTTARGAERRRAWVSGVMTWPMAGHMHGSVRPRETAPGTTRERPQVCVSAHQGRRCAPWCARARHRPRTRWSREASSTVTARGATCVSRAHEDADFAFRSRPKCKICISYIYSSPVPGPSVLQYCRVYLYTSSRSVECTMVSAHPGVARGAQPNLARV